MSIKYWKINKIDCENIEKYNGYSFLSRKVAASRKLYENTINDDFEILNSNKPMKDMDLAVTRIRKAINDEEKIAIYGDYDCDGITSTALLYSYLESEGADISYYIPSRETEGYGLNIDAIKSLKENDIDLIITVDNGISAIDEIDFAQNMGIDIVVTDHHKPREIIPNAAAVVDPHRVDCPSNLTYLCGVGVVFELICAMEDYDYETVLEQYSDIVAIGTIADVVPIIGKNRIYIKRGLKLIEERNRPGISSLLSVSGINENCAITSETVAFSLVPRLNAAGRLGDVEASLVLLLTEDYEQATELSNEIDGYNKRRKEIESQIIAEIASQLKSDSSALNDRVIVLSGENWHHGVIGIVCSRISEKYGKPCIVISKEGEFSRGSGRSVEGFSIIEAISACSDVLTRYGGHPMAAGLTLKTENIGLFTKKINEYAKINFSVMPSPILKIDCEVLPNELTLENVKGLKELEPFGEGNEYPVFCTKNMELIGINELSGGKHIKIKLSANEGTIDVLCFGITKQKLSFNIGDVLDVAFSADINNFNGKESVSLKLRDIKLSNLKQDDILRGKKLYAMAKNNENMSSYFDEIAPNRDDGVSLYKWLRTNGKFERNTEFLYAKANCEIGYGKFLVLLDVMNELKIIEMNNNIQISKVSEKRDFNSSIILKRLRGDLNER